MNGFNQECVEDRNDDERHEDEERGPAPVEDSAVHGVQSQGGHLLADHPVLELHTPLEGCGAGEEQTQHVDAEDEATCA